MADADATIQPRQAEGERKAASRRRLIPTRRRVRLFLLVLGPAILLVIASYFYITGGRYEGTDDAYVKAHMLSISPQVSGKVIDVAVHENQIVEKGQLLFRIKDDRYRVAVADAEANLETVRNNIEQLRATYKQRADALKLTQAYIAYYKRDYDRYKALAQRGVASQQRFEQAQHNLVVAKEQIPLVEAAIDQTAAELGGDPNTPTEDLPQYKAALAQLERARIDLDDTIVTAPGSGVIAQISDFRPGDFVTPGKPLFSLVEQSPVWVEANFKETQLTHMHVGQHATVEVDTYPDVKFDAVVDSIAPATGSEFSLLPAQNSSGNWVKVVQRLPVRLAVRIEPGQPPLRAGMSVNVDVDTEHRRHLPGFLRTALSLFSQDQAVAGESNGQANTPQADAATP
jgi:membrane fusion protein (multidrug efflux system)